MKKVFFLGWKIQTPKTGGETFLKDIIAYLENRHLIEIWDVRDAGWYKKDVHFKFHMRALFILIWANLWAINNFYKKFNGGVLLIDSYFKQQFFLFGLIAKYVNNVPIVTIVQSLSLKSRASKLLNRIDAILLKLLLLASTKAIVTSTSTKKELISLGIPNKKIVVIYPHIDLPERAADFKPKQDEKNLKILFVGYCTPVKELDVLIEAVELLKKHNISVTVIGETAKDVIYFKKIKDKIYQLGIKDKIQFMGILKYSKVWQAYQENDVLVSPGRSEGFGKVIVEAQFFGMAVIGTSEGGSNELIREGINGLLFRSGNAQDLAEKIMFLHKNRNLLNKIKSHNFMNSQLKDAYLHNVGEELYKEIANLLD